MLAVKQTIYIKTIPMQLSGAKSAQNSLQARGSRKCDMILKKTLKSISHFSSLAKLRLCGTQVMR